jgi:hypothetical protein
MKRLITIQVGILMLLTFIAGVRAEDVFPNKNPYASVVARNVFDLKTVVPPSQVIEPIEKITLNGIMSIFGKPQAIFKVADKDGKLASYIFAEGQGKDGIKVVEIDQQNQNVTFTNHGLIQTIALYGLPSTKADMLDPQH